MYRQDKYIRLAYLTIEELQDELESAKALIDYYQSYGNGNYKEKGERINITFVCNGIKSCEQYIIEIERRLGLYSKRINNYLIHFRTKKVQSKGVQLSTVDTIAIPKTKKIASVKKMFKPSVKIKQ